MRKIVFVIISKDQGWSSFPEDHGKFKNTWTWSEVVLRGPTGKAKKRKSTLKGKDKYIETKDVDAAEEATSTDEVIPNSSNNDDEEEQQHQVEGGDVEEEESSSAPPPPPIKAKWEIQRNRHAGKEMEKYCTEFHADSELMQSIEEGDTIELHACAQFPGWLNIVRGAQIQIWSVDALSPIQEHAS